MEQPYAQGTGPSALLPLQHSGVSRVIVDSRFCASYPVEMAIVRELTNLTDGNFSITDVKGNLLFKVKERVISLSKRVILDASGSPVLTLKAKIMTMHGRWQVFRGGSTEPGDLLYTVKQPSIISRKRKFNVFLSHNEEQERCDFRVEGGGMFDTSGVVYSGESDAILAQMQMVHKGNIYALDNFYVKVNPNVDYAFIASLIVIFDALYRPPPKPS